MSVEPKLPPCPHCGGEAERFGCHAHGCEACGCYAITAERWKSFVWLTRAARDLLSVDSTRKEGDDGQ